MGGEQFNEMARHLIACEPDDNAVKRPARHTVAPVCMFHHDILALQRNELLESVVAEFSIPFHRRYTAGQQGHNGGGKAGAGADFQNPMAGLKLQGGNDARLIVYAFHIFTAIKRRGSRAIGKMRPCRRQKALARRCFNCRKKLRIINAVPTHPQNKGCKSLPVRKPRAFRRCLPHASTPSAAPSSARTL